MSTTTTHTYYILRNKDGKFYGYSRSHDSYYFLFHNVEHAANFDERSAAQRLAMKEFKDVDMLKVTTVTTIEEPADIGTWVI